VPGAIDFYGLRGPGRNLGRKHYFPYFVYNEKVEKYLDSLIKKIMSTTAKIITWIVVAVVVVGGGIWWYIAVHQGTGIPAGYGYVAPTSTPSTVNPTQNPPSSMNDDSNATLEAELSGTDSQMNGFSSDNNNMTQASNDQQVQQSQL
jgi:hypothetical protein